MFRVNQMGVYIHWPFCASKCPYCDFNSHVRGSFDQNEWVNAYIKSLEHYASILPDKQVVSIFFGGGTPSLMTSQSVADIIDAVQRLWSISNDLEVTLEANPTSVEMEKFKSFKDAGVNRISLGVQALNDDDLKFLGRGHNVTDALNAIDIAASVFDRYSFDLIYARPKQNIKYWGQELEKAIKYSSGHLSLYQLTIERGTPFYKQHKQGEFSIPDEVKGADFYHITQDIMEGAGLPAYEVSNHAAIGQECRHNLIYWNMADYIGVGAGAHGRFVVGEHKYSSKEQHIPNRWIKGSNHDLEKLTYEDRFFESIMMGLRLYQGISIKRCEKLSGLRFVDMINEDNLQNICAQGWGERDGDNLRLTREGLLRLNAIIPYILK